MIVVIQLQTKQKGGNVILCTNELNQILAEILFAIQTTL
jgi:hypothetical protein